MIGRTSRLGHRCQVELNRVPKAFSRQIVVLKERTSKLYSTTLDMHQD